MTPIYLILFIGVGRIFTRNLGSLKDTNSMKLPVSKKKETRYKGDLRKDLFAQNSTSPEINPDSKYIDRFMVMLERIRKNKFYVPSQSKDDPYGTYLKRHIIGEYTKINGGVYLGATPQEALVIDDCYGFLDSIYTDLMLSLVKKYGEETKHIPEEELIKEVIFIVEQKLRYIPDDKVNFLLDNYPQPDQKIALDLYIEAQVGTDRHQILLAAYLIERLTKQGYLKGKIYIDGSCRDYKKEKERLIYSTANGNLFVFCPSE